MAEETAPDKKRERPQKAVAKKKSAVKKKAAPKKKAAAPGKQETASVDVSKLTDILKNWNAMNNEMKNLAEDELVALISIEQGGKNRIHMLNRIHARFTRVRSERERREIMAGKKLVM